VEFDKSIGSPENTCVGDGFEAIPKLSQRFDIAIGVLTAEVIRI
jgi:hypothetical protein